MEKVEKITFHVISHTHWDREWYLPFEVFRIELVELIDNLLDILKRNKNFIFHLDGQSIILQDYLEIRPHKKEELKKYIELGNILVGPWYVLSDQFLTSGESTIRNLLYGIRDSRDFGNTMMVGYCPDQFGQIAQLPQIFNGFNIKSAVVGRGIQDSISEHNWYGLNGDKVTAIALTHWYNNAQRFPSEKEDLNKYLNKIYDTQAVTSKSGHLLLMNGCDHLHVQKDSPDILKNKVSNQKWELKCNDLEKAIKEIVTNNHIENYPIYFGELRDDNNKYILAGTLSSRVYLKLANHSCQTKLEKIIEPLGVLLALNKKSDYPYDEIKYAWRLLIQNHAHDSICGCSIDEVHKEMETRFAKVSQVLDKLQEKLLSSLTQDHRDAASQHLYLQLINLTSFHTNEIVEAEIEFPLGPPAEHPSASPTLNHKEKIKSLSLKYNGKNIECEIIEDKQAFRMVRSKHEVPLLQAVQKVKILFEANIEPYSIVSYEIVEERIGESANRRGGEELRFENDDYKLEINKNGTVSILLLKDGSQQFKNIHFLSLEDDLGDEYNFVPNKNNKTIFSKDWKWDIEIVEENGFRKKFLLSSNVILSQSPEHSEGTSEESPNVIRSFVAIAPQDDIYESCIRLNTEITCYKNSSRIDFKTKIDNKLKNKRIRLHFPTNLRTNCINADTPFGILQRARPPLSWTNYAASQPLHNWISHSNDKVGLALFGGGLADYELYEDGNGFAITLIRAVGRLSAVKSHSLIETPDAQCNRELEFSYAIYPHSGNWQNANIQNEQLKHQIPIIVNQSEEQIDIQSMIKVSDNMVISSFKRKEDSENIYILRIYNPYNSTFNNCELELNFQFKKVHVLNLNEEVMDSKKDLGEFQIAPYQILTFGIEV